VEPVHSVLGGINTKFLNSWPSHALAIADTGNPPLDIRQVALRELREFIDDEMRLVQRSDTAAVFCVYREAFAKIIDEFSSFSPILLEIQQSYDHRVDELEELTQQLLCGDETIRTEKEKLLGLQTHVITALEKEKKSVDVLRVRASDLEAANAEAERRFRDQMKSAKEEIAALRLEILKEKTVRIEHEDNLNTALRLMREAQERALAATSRLEDIESTLTSEVEKLRRELTASNKELESIKIRSDVALAHAEKKFRDLQSTCIDGAKLAEMKASLEKVGRTNVVLSKRNKWLEEQLKNYQDGCVQ
jgi:chromosome segregation ATPase